MTFKIQISSTVCLVCSWHWSHYRIQVVLSVRSKFIKLKTLAKAGLKTFYVFIKRLSCQHPETQVDKFCSKATLRMKTNDITPSWFFLNRATTNDGLVKVATMHQNKNLQFQLNFVVLQWLLLLWLIIQEGYWLLGTDEDLAVSGNILEGGGGDWSKWKTNASSAHSAIFPVKIKGTPDWPLHGKLEMGPAFVCCC